MGFVPLLSTDILIWLFLYSQPLSKEKEQNKKGKGEKQVQFSPHFLCHSSVIDLGFDKFLWWQCPSQLKVSRLSDKSISASELQDYFTSSFREALENSKNPHSFKSKPTQVFASLSPSLVFIYEVQCSLVFVFSRY